MVAENGRPAAIVGRPPKERLRVGLPRHVRGDGDGRCGLPSARASERDTALFNVLMRGNKTGEWLGVRDDFRNWLMENAA